MSVPVDWTPIVDLSLSDVDADVLVANAVLRGVDVWPEWVPREGNTEVVLLELLAAITAEDVYALNRIPGTVTEGVLRLFGVERNLGTPTAATVTVNAFDTAGHVLPAGTLMRVGQSLDVATTAVLVIAPGSSSTTVAVTAVETGTAGNAIPVGTVVDLVDPASWFLSAYTATVTGGGTDAETDASYLARSGQRLRRVTDSLVLPDHFTAYALENPAVGRATTIAAYDAANSGIIPGANLGYVTVAVATATGGPVSVTVKAQLAADMAARSLAGLKVGVIDAGLVPIAVTATVRRTPSAAQATVAAAIDTALRSFLSAATWPWNRSLQPNDIIAVLEGVPGVDYVEGALVDPVGPSYLQPWQLVTAGTLTITVAAPL